MDVDELMGLLSPCPPRLRGFLLAARATGNPSIPATTSLPGILEEEPEPRWSSVRDLPDDHLGQAVSRLASSEPRLLEEALGFHPTWIAAAIREEPADQQLAFLLTLTRETGREITRENWDRLRTIAERSIGMDPPRPAIAACLRRFILGRFPLLLPVSDGPPALPALLGLDGRSLFMLLRRAGTREMDRAARSFPIRMRDLLEGMQGVEAERLGRRVGRRAADPGPVPPAERSFEGDAALPLGLLHIRTAVQRARKTNDEHLADLVGLRKLAGALCGIRRLPALFLAHRLPMPQGQLFLGWRDELAASTWPWEKELQDLRKLIAVPSTREKETT